jgi:hypothetical protein
MFFVSFFNLDYGQYGRRLSNKVANKVRKLFDFIPDWLASGQPDSSNYGVYGNYGNYGYGSKYFFGFGLFIYYLLYY